MPNHLGEDGACVSLSTDGERTRRFERVLCLFDAGAPTNGQFLRAAEALAEGGRFVVPVEDASVAQSLKPDESDAFGEYETRFLERPSTITTEWVNEAVRHFGITTIFDVRNRTPTLGGGELALTTDCDHVAVDAGDEVDNLSSCLVPVCWGPHLDATLDAVRAIARSNDAWIDLFHVVEDENRREPRLLFEYCEDQLGLDEVDTWCYEGRSPARAIVDQSPYYDATVVAAPRKGRLFEFVDGSTTETVQSFSESAVVTVRSGDVGHSRLGRWLGELLAP